MNKIIAEDSYYRDIQNEEAFNNFRLLNSMITNLKAPDSLPINPNTTEGESKSHIKDILEKILGLYYVPYINKTISLIKHSANTNLMSGCYYAVDNRIYQIEVPHMNNHLGVIVGAHESAHVISEFSDIKNQAYYKEVMSILIDKISANMMNKQYPKYNIENNWLKWRLVNLMEHPCNIDNLDLNEQNRLVEIRKLFLRNSYIYLLGDIYATSLFEKYKQNNYDMISTIREYYNEDVTMDYILNYYDISLSNEETINNYKQYIKQYNKPSLWQ